MSFIFKAIDNGDFKQYYGLSDAELTQKGIPTYIADSETGYPCRVSLANAKIGDRLLLLNYEHLPVDSPYRSSHAIFVNDGATSAQIPPNHIPPMIGKYLLSMRAFDAKHMMLDAEVVEGEMADEAINKMFRDTSVKYLHIHTARRGCFLVEVVRNANEGKCCE